MIFEKAINIIEGNLHNDVIYKIDDDCIIKLFGHDWAIIWLYNIVKANITSIIPHIRVLCFHPSLNPLRTNLYYPFFKKQPNENMTYIKEILNNPVDKPYINLTCQLNMSI